MYLHEDKERFFEIAEWTAKNSSHSAIVIEKDYYVTMILRLLSERLPNVVFKGGTSLSKGFKVINRFSEDIDITFDEHIGASRRKKLKNEVLKSISDDLGMPISNWNETQSDRDYNCYNFSYKSLWEIDDRMLSSIKLETALGSYAFPTKMVPIDNYIGNTFLMNDRSDLVEMFKLGAFKMKLQSVERTYVDKIYALCDYYIQGKSKRYSRHLYDIYKLTSKIDVEDTINNLFYEIRNHRKNMNNCPSAKNNINISDTINAFCDDDFYKNDYQEVTNYFIDDYVTYEDTIEQMRKLSVLLSTV